MYFLYYLLYKLTNSDILWIVNVDDQLDDLFKNIVNFKSKEEKYLLVRKNLKFYNKSLFEEELERKQFRIFEICSNDKIIYET